MVSISGNKLAVIVCLLAVALCASPTSARRRVTSLHKWFKVACIAENLKDNAHYICDKHGFIHCLPGWTNEANDCKDPYCETPCVKGQGNCTAPNTCTCAVGWTGNDCSQCVCLPGCQHGSCEVPFECICDDGYEGMLCSKPKCKPGCVHGTCTKPGQCICHPGWRGENCDECIPLPGCSGYGYCDKPMECKCLEGYEGSFCHKASCSAGCHPEYGFCRRPNECWCHPGWTGDNCTQCVPYPGCLNGQCDFPWECKCNPGFRGKLCDIEGDETTTVFPHHKPTHLVPSGFDFPSQLVNAADVRRPGDFFKRPLDVYKRASAEMDNELPADAADTPIDAPTFIEPVDTQPAVAESEPENILTDVISPDVSA